MTGMERSNRCSAARWGVLGLALFAAVGFVLAGNDKAIRDKAIKLGEALENKDDATAKKLLDELIQLEDADPETLMNLLGKRNDKGTGGLGIGDKPGAIKPDHIDKKFDEMTKKALTKKELDDHGAALARAAYQTAGLMKAFAKKCPKKVKSGDQDPKQWEAWSEECNKYALELAEALKAKKADEAKKACDKMYNACSACHSVWR
jgi:hypothetical protein